MQDQSGEGWCIIESAPVSTKPKNRKICGIGETCTQDAVCYPLGTALSLPRQVGPSSSPAGWG